MLGKKPADRAAVSGADTAHPSGIAPCVQDAATRHVVQHEALIEDFQSGSLVLLCERLRFVQMNSVARAVVGLLDGQRTVCEIGVAIAESYDRPFELVLEDVRDLLAYVESRGVVEPSTRGCTDAPVGHTTPGTG